MEMATSLTCTASLAMVLISIVTLEVEAQTVLQIHAKTADEDDAGMNRGTVDMELENAVGETCNIKEMSTGNNNDYSRGEIGYSIFHWTNVLFDLS